MRGSQHHHHHHHSNNSCYHQQQQQQQHYGIQQPHHGCGGVRRGRNKCGWPEVAVTVYVTVAAAVAACYWNGLSGDFVHDDIPAVAMNADVLGTGPLAHVVTNDFWGTPMSDPNSHKSYRPLTTLTFRCIEIPFFFFFFFGLLFVTLVIEAKGNEVSIVKFAVV